MQYCHFLNFLFLLPDLPNPTFQHLSLILIHLYDYVSGTVEMAACILVFCDHVQHGSLFATLIAC